LQNFFGGVASNRGHLHRESAAIQRSDLQLATPVGDAIAVSEEIHAVLNKKIFTHSFFARTPATIVLLIEKTNASGYS
jgi:hypothetical protein